MARMPGQTFGWPGAYYVALSLVRDPSPPNKFGPSTTTWRGTPQVLRGQGGPAQGPQGLKAL